MNTVQMMKYWYLDSDHFIRKVDRMTTSKMRSKTTNHYNEMHFACALTYIVSFISIISCELCDYTVVSIDWGK